MKELIRTGSVLMLLFSLVLPICNSQVVISEKAVFHLDNVSIKVPEIKLVQPEITPGKPLAIEMERLKILGNLKNGNGKQKIFINNSEVVIYGDSVFYADLPLVAGPNPVKIDLFTDNSLVNTYNYSVFRIVKQANTASFAKGKYYALIIGINKYSDPLFNELDYCIRDAELFYNTITSRYTFEKENVKFLQNASMADMVEALDYSAKLVKPEDNFLIFYAGHGVWDAISEIGFWLPSDAKKSSKLAWFRNSTLRDYLREIHSKHTLLISDACFAGSIFKSRAAFADAPLAINKLYELPSRKAMTSGQLTEVPDQSAFIKYLVDRLANNTERYVSSEQLFSSFRIAVINNSSVVPQFGEIREVGDEGGDFIFILKEDQISSDTQP
jgi:hypothetical protein